MEKYNFNLLNYLSDKNVSNEEKMIIVNKNNSKLKRYSKYLTKKGLTNCIINPNMPISVKKIFSTYIDSLEPDEDEIYEFIKIFNEIDNYSEADLIKDYYPHSLKKVIAKKIYSDKLYQVICDSNFPFETKKLIIDSLTTAEKISKILSLNPPEDIVNYIIETKNSYYMISQLLSNKETPINIKEEIIAKSIDINNIFRVCTSAQITNFQATKIMKIKSNIIDKHIKKISGRLALEELRHTNYPQFYKEKLYTTKKASIKLATLLLGRQELLEYLDIDNSEIKNLILTWRKVGITLGAITSPNYMLISWLKSKYISEDTKKLMIKLNKPRIIKQIKKMKYYDISCLFMEKETGLPTEIENEIIRLRKEDIIKECGTSVIEGRENNVQKIVIEIMTASNQNFKNLIISEKINEENILEVLNASLHFKSTTEKILSEKTKFIDKIIRDYIEKEGLDFKKIKLNSELIEKILLKKSNIIEEYIKNITKEEKYKYLKNNKEPQIVKKIIINSLGFSKSDTSCILALINKFDVENVIKNYYKLKESLENLKIDFNYFVQYGIGSSKYRNWFNELINLIQNDEIKNLLIVKTYLFNELYDKEKLSKNEIYKINCLLETIDSFYKSPELLKKISNNKVLLTKNDKKNLLELRNLPCYDMKISSLEELKNKVEDVNKLYIKQIYEENITVEELKEIFNNVILKNSNELLKNIGGIVGIKMLQNSNKQISSINNLCEELLLYAKIIETVNATNNLLGLKKTLKILCDERNLTTVQDVFSSFEEKVRLLFEIDSIENLTPIEEIKKNISSDKALEKIYGKEVFDLSNKNYILYAHVMSENESIEELVEGRASSNKNFISLSPISYKGQKLYWGGRESILAYDKIKEGSFICSSTANMGTNRALRENSTEVDEIKRHQRGILETSAVFKNNPETLLYREGLKPCGIILVGGKNPNKAEIMWHKKYNLPFIITQEAENSITAPEKMFNPNNNTRYESNNIEPLKNIIKLLEPNLTILKENNVYTGREIAIFTDAHALYEPTFAILEDIRKRGINEIYSLGDNIGFGPNPKEVIDLLDEYNVISIAGNSEYYSTLGIEPFASYFDTEKTENQLYTDEELGSVRIERLKLYKPSINLILNNKKIALCHFANDIRWDYNLHSTWTYQNQDKTIRPNQFLYTNTKEAQEQIENNIGLNKGFEDAYINPIFEGKKVTDYYEIIQGHVHFEMNDKLDKTHIKTLRAVAMGYKGETANTACYYILKERKDGNISIEKVLVPFNKSNLICTINSSALPNKSKVLRYIGA